MVINREMLDNYNFDVPDLIDTVRATWRALDLAVRELRRIDQDAIADTIEAEAERHE